MKANTTKADERRKIEYVVNTLMLRRIQYIVYLPSIGCYNRLTEAIEAFKLNSHRFRCANEMCYCGSSKYWHGGLSNPRGIELRKQK